MDFARAVGLALKGIVAKRIADAYDASAIWLKVKHRNYSQNEGRGNSFRAVRPLDEEDATRVENTP
jgi:ATP-dependent DNA ligase